MKTLTPAVTTDGLTAVAYPGKNKILLAMSLAESAVSAGAKNLAGFAIWRSGAVGAEVALANRISFSYGVSSATTSATRKWTPSDQAPFQKFRWVDVPPDGFDSPLTYRIRALYFSGQGTATTAGPEVKLTVGPSEPAHSNFRVDFTRGYIASQAYADKFHNADIRPAGPKTPDFDTKPYLAEYEWLGADARRQLFDFLTDCANDKKARVDVFAYDLDEPDIIRAICGFGKEGRLRAILDNAALHVTGGKNGPPPEVKAAQLIIAAAGAAKVRRGHFDRFQHNKVFIKRDASGQAQRVLFGSMNFSVRGLYVQANNIAVVDDANVAGMFAKAFDVAFADNVQAGPFRQDPIAQGYMTGSATDTAQLPKFSLALSPHQDASVSLGPMSTSIRGAASSVLFAVMAPTGGGPVLTSLRTIAAQPTVFSYGTVETDKGLAVQSPDGQLGAVTGYATLAKNVPQPFVQEFSGGPGIHIHDKFVVVDFNADKPVVFMGSSNLAAGGEHENGDSLCMIEDGAVANMYAIEAVALFDHYHFRKVMQATAPQKPFSLWYPGKAGASQPWWQAYYDPHSIQLRDRCLFAKVPLPPGLETTKTVDWSAIDKAAANSGSGQTKKKGSARRAPAKKAAPNRRRPASSPRKTPRSGGAGRAAGGRRRRG